MKSYFDTNDTYTEKSNIYTLGTQNQNKQLLGYWLNIDIYMPR
jgi:hypothetical protein